MFRVCVAFGGTLTESHLFKPNQSKLVISQFGFIVLQLTEVGVVLRRETAP